MQKNKMALTASKKLGQGVKKSLELIEEEIKERVRGIKEILIKVNFVTVYRDLAATPVESVTAGLDFLKSFYKGKIVIAEGATIGQTDEGWKNYGYEMLKKRYGVELVDLNQDKTIDVEVFDRRGIKFKIPFCQRVAEAEFIVSICRPKTHDTVVATLSLKNLLVGSLLNRSRIHQGRWINWSLAKLAEFKKPDLAIIDGTVGMEGDGPVGGEAIKTGWVVAGLDFLAVDSLALDLMGIDLNDVGYLKLCQERGLGNVWQESKIVGEKAEKFRKKFKMHKTFEEQRKWRN